MVVSVGELDCLDYLIWLRSGVEAGRRLGFSQSAISRTVQRVAESFGVRAVKLCGEWSLLGDTTLLNQERLFHQKYRWKTDRPLRFEAQYHSGTLFSDCLPKRWIKGCLDYFDSHTPLQHLLDGVIDAWIGFFPDLPEENHRDLCSVHLTRMPLRLVVDTIHPLVELGDAITLDDVRRYPSLALPDNLFPKFQAQLQKLGLWNVPIPLRRYNHCKWVDLIMGSHIVGYATSLTFDYCSPSQVLLPIQVPLEVGDSLIVRREYVKHPHFQDLLACLKGRTVELQQRFLDVRLCFLG